MFSLMPQEVPSFSTLFRPFGHFLWVSIVGTTGLLTIVLVISGSNFSLGTIVLKGKFIMTPSSKLLWLFFM